MNIPEQLSFRAGLLLLALMFSFTSCLRKDHDAPPDLSATDPGLHVTHTIAQLKAMNGPYITTTEFDTTLITEEVIIEGVITADDRSGNFYKQIIIQDSTAAIAVNIEAYSLYNHYPVGRKVYVKCKGLYLGYDVGVPVLGSTISEQKSTNGIVGSDIDAHIIKAGIGHAIKDTVITLAAAKEGNPFFFNRLVTIADVEFLDTTKSYTEPSANTNRYFVNCALNATSSTYGLPVIRTSNYANFHGLNLPSGHGSITGIYTVYQASASNITVQMIVRDTNDVKLHEGRCNGIVPPPVTNSPLITIDSMRKLFTASARTTYTLPAAKIAGVIISDIDQKNVSTGNFIVQDNSGRGVILFIGGSTAYKLGDSVVVEITGATLKLYNGVLEMDNLSIPKVAKIASGKSVAPVTLTIAQLNANFTRYESTLVKIVGASIGGGGTYSGNKNLDDGTGSLTLYTSSIALFAGLPTAGSAKTYVGIITPYITTGSSTNEFKLRNPATDVY